MLENVDLLIRDIEETLLSANHSNSDLDKLQEIKKKVTNLIDDINDKVSLNLKHRESK